MGDQRDCGHRFGERGMRSGCGVGGGRISIEEQVGLGNGLDQERAKTGRVQRGQATQARIDLQLRDRRAGA